MLCSSPVVLGHFGLVDSVTAPSNTITAIIRIDRKVNGSA